MPTQCFMATNEEDKKRIGALWYDATKPDVWKALIESDLKRGKKVEWSDEYIRDWLGKRSPLYARLPNGESFCLDRKATHAGDSGWTVSGEAPNITTSPSINFVPNWEHGWHGYIRNGVMDDDMNGRNYGSSEHRVENNLGKFTYKIG